MSSLLTAGVNSLESVYWGSVSCLKPLLLLRASSLSSACPTSRGHRCLWCTCQHLLALFTEQSPCSPYPNPHISSTSLPCRINRLLCKPPGLQLPSGFSKRSGVSAHWCTSFRSCFWWEGSWSAGTGHVWSWRLDEMTFRSPFQPIHFY